MKKAFISLIALTALALALCSCSQTDKIGKALQQEQWVHATEDYVAYYSFSNKSYTVTVYNMGAKTDSISGSYKIKDGIIDLSESDSSFDLAYKYEGDELTVSIFSSTEPLTRISEITY